MKLTKTKSVLMILTLALLVLTLGFGLLFLQKSSTASAEEAGTFVPLADAELQSTKSAKIFTPGGTAIWWSGAHEQLRIHYKIEGASPARGSSLGSHIYDDSEKLEITSGGVTKTAKAWGVGNNSWIDNAESNVNGPSEPGDTYEIWIWAGGDKLSWLQGITEIHFLPGFGRLDAKGGTPSATVAKDFYLWRNGNFGWQTRIDPSKGIEVTYNGDGVAFGEVLDPSDFTVKATLKGSEEPTEIDASGCTFEYSYNGLAAEGGQMSVTVKYQDATSQPVNVTVAADADPSKGLVPYFDYAQNNDYRTDWNGQGSQDNQLLLFFNLKGEVTAPAAGLNQFAYLQGQGSKGTRILDYIVFNGTTKLSEITDIFDWIGQHAAGPQGSASSPYALWFCPVGTENNGWRGTIQTVTIKAGFTWANASGDMADLMVKEDYTLYNAHNAGWQRAVESISAEYTGDEVEVGSSLDLSKLTITGKFMDKSPDATIDNSKVTIGALPSDAGSGNVQITYQGKTCECAVNMKASKKLTGVTVEGADDVTAEQWTRPTFDGITVKAQFEGAEAETLEKGQYTITCDTWTLGQQEATVSYTYGGETKSTTFNVNVTANTATDKYFEILDDEKAARSTSSAFPGYYDAGLAFRINFVGVELGAYNGATANYYFDKVKGIHLNEYIEFVIGGDTKTAAELFTDGTLTHIGISDTGKLVICFKDTTERDKVTQVTFKAGMEFASNQNAFDFNADQTKIDQNAIFLPNAVLKRDYVYSNGGAKGWLKVADTLNVTVAGGEIPQNAPEAEVKAKLTVTVKYKGETEETTLKAADYTLELDTSELGDSVTGTVTYREATKEFTTKVVESKELERIELSGTTTFTGERFGTAPELTGFTITAYYVGNETGVVLEKGFTVGKADMWLEEGAHNIEVSYTEGGETKTANLTLTITAPNLENGLEVLHDYEVESPPPSSWDSGFWGPTGWGNQASNNSQIILYFRAKGDVTLPATGALDQFVVNGTSKGTHILDYILINGQPYSAWKDAFGGGSWIGLHSAGPQGTADGSTPYLLWLNPSGGDNSWRNSITTITIKAGFQWASSASGDVAGAVVKEDITLWNAKDAGWKLHADSVKVELKEGATVYVGDDIRTKIDVKAVFGTEEKAVTDYTVTDYTAETAGEQTITVTYQDQTATLKINVEEAPAPVTPEPESVTLDKSEIETKVGVQPDLSTITATVKYKENAKADLTFKLNALPEGASLSAIDVSAKGNKTITLTYVENETTVTATFTLKVTEEAAPPATQYTVKFAVGDHAAADATAPNEQKADKDAQITLPAAPKAAEGYKFDGWYDGTTKVGDANAKYTVTKDVTLTAHWAKDETPVEPGPGGDQPGGDQPANPENPDGNEPAEDEGCGSVISVSGMIIAFVTLVGAAVVVIAVRKQRN